MDIVKSCQADIQRQLNEINQLIDDEKLKSSQHRHDSISTTQSLADTFVPDKDKNLDRILDQQAHLKMIIERDGRIILLNKQIAEDIKTIELLRRSCATIERDALKMRQDLLMTQSNELERFQMAQLKSITDDYKRHQEILESRKKEIERVKSETEKEESNRGAYLLSYEKDLERQFQSRKKLNQTTSLGQSSLSSAQGVTDEINNPDFVELESVDEYAPYGPTPSSRVTTNHNHMTTNSRRGAGSSGRGRRGGRGRGSGTAVR